MIKWGISAYNHNAAISVVKDDQILFASESERYSGIKNDSNIPDNMIKEVLEYGEPDQIHWYENQLLKNIRRLYAGQKWKKLDIHPWIKRKRIRYHGHHETHARAGFYTSPFDSATVLVVDAIGEFNTTSIWHATNKHLTKFWT